MLDEGGSAYKPLYSVDLPIREKIDTIVRKVYGGEGADYSAKAERTIVRYSFFARALHWTVAFTFVYLMLTGLGLRARLAALVGLIGFLMSTKPSF